MAAMSTDPTVAGEGGFHGVGRHAFERPEELARFRLDPRQQLRNRSMTGGHDECDSRLTGHPVKLDLHPGDAGAIDATRNSPAHDI